MDHGRKDPVLLAEGIRVDFGGPRALDEVDLAVAGPGIHWAMFVVLLRDIVNTHTRLWGLVMGAVFMLAVLAFRQGIAGPVFRRLKE